MKRGGSSLESEFHSKKPKIHNGALLEGCEPLLPVLPTDLIWLLTSLLDPASIVALAFTCSHFEALLAGRKRLVGDFSKLKTDQKVAKVLNSAAKRGYKSLVVWLKQLGCPWGNGVSEAASKGGQLQLLKWLERNKCPFNMNTIVRAASQRGQMNVLQYYQSIIENDHSLRATICIEASKGGFLEVLQWLNVKRIAIENILSLLSAAAGGHIMILEWLSKGVHPSELDYAPLRRAIQAGKWEAVKWMLDNGWTATQYTCFDAVEAGQLEILKKLQDRGLRWNSVGEESFCAVAAKFGYLDILKYGFESGHILDEATCHNAAQTGDTSILQWLHEKGCVMNERHLVEAIRKGKYEAVLWLHAHGCRLDTKDPQLCHFAVRAGNLILMKWLHQKGCPVDTYLKEILYSALEPHALGWLLGSLPIPDEIV